MGVVQALARCGEPCGLHVHVLFGGSCAIPTRWAGQSFPKLRECNLRIQGIGWVGVSGNCSLTKMGNRLYYVQVAGSLNFLSIVIYADGSARWVSVAGLQKGLSQASFDWMLPWGNTSVGSAQSYFYQQMKANY